MAVVATWDGANRRIHLLQGVTEFHPIDDIYREYRAARRTDESLRVWEPFMVAIGNVSKGGGKFTPRYLQLLDDGDIGQVKIVPYDEATDIDVTGEVLTDDQTRPVDLSTITSALFIHYYPPEAEIISVGGSGLTAQESQALLDIDSNVGILQADVDDIGDGVFGQKVLIDSLDKTTLPGYMIMWDELGVLLGHKELWQDHVLAGYPANVGYTRAGKGYAFEGPLTAGMPP